MSDEKTKLSSGDLEALKHERIRNAAPELLAALKSLAREATWDADGEITLEQFEAVMASADAAIAKAEGQS